MSPNPSDGSIELTHFMFFFFSFRRTMSLFTLTAETDPLDADIGPRNISTSSSFINYTMLNFNNGEVDEDAEEDLYRDGRKTNRMGCGNSLLMLRL